MIISVGRRRLWTSSGATTKTLFGHRRELKPLLMRIPTADVEPVRHGRWKPVFDSEAFWGDPEAAMADEITGYECSICERTCAFTNGNGEYILPDVCPGCRAKMDGGGEDAAD